MSNQLAAETSPYLLQHADNPVHWYPWGEQALTLAREQNKPILLSNYDSVHGGFGDAPKFPQPMALEFGLREYLRNGNVDLLNAVTTTLQRMANGGIYDLLGGGFARYATDVAWLVPHFEKMLYDNAQLARVYLHAWQITGEPRFREVVEQTLDYLLHEMRHEDGGFYSSEDADSEGVEGKFYVWSAAEIRAALGADAKAFMQACGVSDAGNWEGTNILHRPTADVEISESARQKLFELRSQRIRPGLDDKILTAWNGLALAAFAEAGRVLGREDYLLAAVQNAEFIYRELRLENGRLLRSWKAGHGARYSAYLEDYACLVDGSLALYESTFDERWYVWANELADLMLQHFRDPDGLGFFDTADDHEKLVLRPRDLQDNAMPSGNARAASVLFRLGLLSGRDDYSTVSSNSVEAMSNNLSRYPMGFGEWLSVASVMLGNSQELALIGDKVELEIFRQILNETYRPNLVVAAGPGTDSTSVPLLQGRGKIDGEAAAYLCQRFSCSRPVTTAVELAALLTAGD